MTQYAIEIKGACKKFREVEAVKGVNVSFEAGQIHGLVGRNGSGKTVLLKCICGFMSLTSGSITVAGQKVSPTKPQEIGVIIETPGFIGSASGRKNLEMLASINRKIDKKAIVHALEAVGLDPNMRKLVRKYSLGMKQRLGIAQAIMESPDILLFDEPMNGLDNTGLREMRALFRQLREEGHTIIMASHNIADIDELCDTVCEMDAGVLDVKR